MLSSLQTQAHAQVTRALRTFARTPLLLASFTGLVAVVVILGWHAGFNRVVQLRPDLIPMPYNSALMLLLASAALVMLVRHKVVAARLMAGGGLVFSALTMMQYFTGADFGIDRLLMEPYITPQPAFPGRMALTTSFCYLVLNTGYLLFTLGSGERQPRFLASLCAAIVIACVIATVIGYEADVQPLFGWSAATYMTLHSALGLSLLALGLLACNTTAADESYTLFALAGFIAVASTALLLWSGLTRQRDEQIQQELDADLHLLSFAINSVYEEHLNTLERMRRRWERGDGTARAIWETDSNSYIETLSGVKAMHWIDPHGAVQWSVPAGGSNLGPNSNVFTGTRIADFERARATRTTAFTLPMPFVQGGNGFFLIMPLFAGERFDGFVVAELQVDALFDEVSDWDPSIPFDIRFSDQLLFRSALARELPVGNPLSMAALLAMNDGDWTVEVLDGSLRQAGLRNRLPDVVLLVGVLIAAFLAAVLRLWGVSRRHLVEATTANAALLASQQQLNQFRTTLDRTLDCVFMFDADTMTFFYGNAGALRLTGYSASELYRMHPWEMNPERDEAGFRELVQPLVANRVDSLTFDTTQRNAGGEIIPVELFLQYIAPRREAPRFVAVVRDITQRKRVEQMKSEFVSTVSHELRTPLTSISGALGLVLGGALGTVEPQVRPMLEIAHKNSRSLTHLINDLLDIEKIAAGKLNFDLQVQSLLPLVEQAVEGTRTYGAERRVQLVITSMLAGLDVRVDSQRLLQILGNLLSNAIKFSPEGGRVEVAMTQLEGRVRLSVRDYGRGIPAEFRDRIFQKFAQADASDTRKQSGTGLGLAISRELAERMGGQLGFDSIEGQGATFFLDLPVVRHELQRAAQPPHLLIVEDEPDAALLLRQMLADAGYVSDVAATGAAALEALEERAYSAVILDLRLPDMNGIDIIRRLRARPDTADLPVLVVSACLEEGRLQINGDFSDIVWLPKPVDGSGLLHALATVAGRGNARRVLHVEDDADLHEVIKGMTGGRVELARAGSLQEARAMLRQEAFLAVMLDLGLPDGSGWDLVPLIQALDPPPRLIILTAQDTAPLDPGRVDSILLKSRVTPRQLLDAIQVMVDERAAFERPPA